MTYRNINRMRGNIILKALTRLLSGAMSNTSFWHANINKFVNKDYPSNSQ